MCEDQFSPAFVLTFPIPIFSYLSLSGTDGTDGKGGKATLFGNKIPIGTKPPDFQL
jgi:hypothetical protein